MIAVKLIGGLGNQMFQYACARRLAVKRGVKLKLDLTFLLHRLPRQNFTFRNYGLGVFNINENFTFLSKIAFRFNNLAFIASFIISRLVNFFYPGYRIEEVDPKCFEPRILNLRNRAYLSGVWAHEKYFSDVDDTIRRDFSFKEPLEGKNIELASMINSCDSVFIHVRRGDHIQGDQNKPAVAEKRDLRYCQEACDYILKKMQKPVFFIFSDDPNWVKEKLMMPQCVVVDSNTGKNSYLDMRLMSLCKHSIISSSTFSWWAAWLNANPKKIVIAPKQWNNFIKYDHDFFTKNWIEF
ncbi:MAG: alpha-1,2-fucosyltransferase [Patescibacteria group bacterium]